MEAQVGTAHTWVGYVCPEHCQQKTKGGSGGENWMGGRSEYIYVPPVPPRFLPGVAPGLAPASDQVRLRRHRSDQLCVVFIEFRACWERWTTFGVLAFACVQTAVCCQTADSAGDVERTRSESWHLHFVSCG